MALLVIAEPADQFAHWRDAQLAAANAPQADLETNGRDVFLAHCSVCHTVRGAGADGLVGPDLTHLMSRQTIAAGWLPNDKARLSAWIVSSQNLKPGNRMPDIPLAGPELQQVVAYLEGLR
jgi:cytochrome c oxidase subunit 2